MCIRDSALSDFRRKQKGEKTTENEKSALRGLLGGLNWFCTQTGMNSCAEVSLLQSTVPISTVDTILQANKLPVSWARRCV